MQSDLLRGSVADERWASGNGDATLSKPPDSWEEYEPNDGWRAESSAELSGKFRKVSLDDPVDAPVRGGEDTDARRQSTWGLGGTEDIRYSDDARYGGDDTGEDRYEDGLPVSDRGPGQYEDDEYYYDHDDVEEEDNPGNHPRDDSAYSDREADGGDGFDGFFHPHERENHGDGGIEADEEEEWWEMWSARDNDFYYHNKRTDEVVWDPPEGDVIIRYGTGPDGGAPYYSPFDSKGVQEFIAAPMRVTATVEADSMDEFLTLPSLPTLKKSNTLETDVSFGTGVPSLQFSFDGKNERDLEAFLEYFDSDRCLTKTGSFAGTEVSNGAGRLSPTGQQVRSCNRSPSPSAGSPRRISPPSTAKADSPRTLPPAAPRDRRCSPPLSPGSDTRSSPRSPNRYAGSPRPSSLRSQPPPPSSIFQARNQTSPRTFRGGRMPAPPSTNMWGVVPDSSSVAHSSPFATFSSSSLINRDSASLALDEDIITEIVNTLPAGGVSSAIQGLPSLEIDPPVAPLGGVPSLSGGLLMESVSTDIDAVFGRNQPPAARGESSDIQPNGETVTSGANQ